MLAYDVEGEGFDDLGWGLVLVEFVDCLVFLGVFSGDDCCGGWCIVLWWVVRGCGGGSIGCGGGER
jgi:hypothetical protein